MSTEPETVCRTETGDRIDKRHPRRRTFLRGRVEFNNRMSSLDCVIRDLSDAGARLELADSVTIPEVFDLSVPVKGMTKVAHVIWRTATHVGLSFASSAPAPTLVETSLERRVKELEAENAGLRRLLDQMRAEASEDKSLAI